MYFNIILIDAFQLVKILADFAKQHSIKDTVNFIIKKRAMINWRPTFFLDVMIMTIDYTFSVVSRSNFFMIR